MELQDALTEPPVVESTTPALAQLACPATVWQYGCMVKLTFTLDDETVARLRKIAARTRKPQSLVVREAIAEYAARGERLTDEERARALEAYDALAPAVGRRSPAAIARELRELRTARRSGGRRIVVR
jgi:predicted transcriptional regulator